VAQAASWLVSRLHLWGLGLAGGEFSTEWPATEVKEYAMTRSDWLYPISESAGTWWEDSEWDVTASISLRNFRDLILPGLLGDSRWFISKNFRKVQVGDRVWIYLSGGTGVIGLARLAGVDHVDGRWQVSLVFNKAASRRLCANPYPGAKVNQHLPYPRGTVTSLNDHSRLVRALERAAGI